MRKKILFMCCMIFIAASLTGCEEEYVEQDTEVQTMEVDQETGEVNLNQILDIPGEYFKLVCDYDTGRYDIGSWRVTDSKVINMTAHTSGLPEGYEVYIDHVHADISLASTSPQINGIIQDSMDDTSHASPGRGFYISNESIYNNTFAIEGYTQQFYELWGYAFGTYGTLSSSYERLTEKNIVEVGTYAEKVQVVYDIAIKAPEDPDFHTVSVLSEFFVPVNQDTSEMTREVDPWTGEPVE